MTTVCVVAAITAACGPSSPAPELEPLRLSSDLLTTTAPPPTTSPEERATQVVSDYRHNWQVLFNAYANTNVAGLHLISSGPILYGVTDDILYGKRYGLALDGSFTSHPRVESADHDIAVVVDCMVVQDLLRDSLTNEVIDEWYTNWEIRVELVWEGDTWKLHDWTELSTNCVPPEPLV
jgi:hypothetical protein